MTELLTQGTELLGYLVAGAFGALGNHCLHMRARESGGAEGEPFFDRAASLFILTGAGFGLFVGVDTSSFSAALGGGGVWPTFLRAANDVQVWQAFLRKKLGLQTPTPPEGS